MVLSVFTTRSLGLPAVYSLCPLLPEKKEHSAMRVEHMHEAAVRGASKKTGATE